MAVFVKEYDWMWLPTGLNLSPAECRVFAYIYGLTESKHSKTKGYNGTVRQLAKDLGITPGHVSRILHKLQTSNLIVLSDDVWVSVALCNERVALNNASVTLSNESVSLCNESVALNNSPLTTPLNKEIIKEMERNNIIARDTIVTPNPQSLFSFNEFLSSYRAATNTNAQYSAEVLADARNLWDALKRYQQQQLLRALNSGTWSKPRLDWTITDFRFQAPTNYAGRSTPRNMTLYHATFEGLKGVFTEQDVRDFCMTEATFFMNT